MATHGLALFAAVLVLTVALGAVFAFRTDWLLGFQERSADWWGIAPPSENPEYYEDTTSYRRRVLQFGGAVLLVVGLGGLAVLAYGVFLA